MEFKHAMVPKPRPGSVDRDLHPTPQQSDPLELEDIEDSDFEEDCVEAAPPRSPGVKAAVDIPAFASGGVKCTCAHQTSNQGRVKGHTPTPECKVKGRVPTPELRKSASPTRHHLDLTTPSDKGLLIPMTTYPHVLPNFRHDMKSTAPVNPLTVESVDHLIKDSRKAKKAVREEVSSVPKHIPASSSPHHSHCVPNGIGPRAKGLESIPNGVPAGEGRRGTASPHHVRKLNFEHIVPSQPAPRRSQPSYQTRPTSMSGSSAQSLSCQTCGACLQSSIPPPPSSAPKVQTLYPATLNTRPATALGHIPMQNIVPGTGGKLAGSQRHGSAGELFTTPTPGKGRMEFSRSPTPPLSRANTYAPAAHGGAYTRVSHPKPSYHKTLEVDELSLSSMSLSNCSVASELLEKARKRRDKFWTSQVNE